MKKDTSWNKVAPWYDELVDKPDSYQNTVILPNLIRLLNIKKGEKILDLGCGQGFFTREFFKLGAEMTGVDLAGNLIKIAKKDSPKEIKFIEGSADKLGFFNDNYFDTVVIVLALQNMELLDKVLSECKRVLKKGGRLVLVLNHPAYRIPKKSDWFFDEEKNVQYRRVERYLSEFKSEIEMSPGADKSSEKKVITYSFHRPLQLYFKFLHKNNFTVARLEEWISPKKSGYGPRQKAEDTARKEIPLFMFLECLKN